MPASRGCGDAIGAALGAGEDDRAGERGIGEQFDQHVAFARRVDKDDFCSTRSTVVAAGATETSPARAAIRRRAC